MSAFISAESMYGENESKRSRKKISDVYRCLPLRADFRQAYFWIFLFLQISCRVHFFFYTFSLLDFLVKTLHAPTSQVSLGINFGFVRK